MTCPVTQNKGYHRAYTFGTKTAGTLYYGNPTLSPTAVRNAELAYDRTVSVIGSVVRTAIFAQRNDNLLAAAPSVPAGLIAGQPYQSQSANIGSSDEVGLEFIADMIAALCTSSYHVLGTIGAAFWSALFVSPKRGAIRSRMTAVSSGRVEIIDIWWAVTPQGAPKCGRALRPDFKTFQGRLKDVTPS
jgi:hypothetical protein